MTDKTRENLLQSATEVFVKKGFSGARVDEIAREANANKAMIYYHFQSKEGLYKAVLLRQISVVKELVLGAAESERDPLRRLQSLYDALGRAFQASPALPHMMIREVLAGGVHMDSEVAGAFKGIVDVVRTSVEEGARAGLLRDVNPLFLHVMMIAPLILFNVSRPYRERFLPLAAPDVDPLSADAFHAQLEDVLARFLEPCEDARAPNSRSHP